MKYYMQQHYYKNSTKVRVYVSSAQGGRKYQEDEYSIVHHKCPPNQTNSKKAAALKRPFMFFGIFDGHGGEMAAQYCRDNLYQNIIRQREFWSDDDKKICLAIHRGFVRTQRNMLNEVDKWPKTSSGLPSTAGTTASIVFIINGKYYTGHVGDSRIILGRQELNSDRWTACPMTRDHKPESPREKKRIEAAGGQVINKSGVGRVVWNRPKPYLNPSASPRSEPQSYDVIPFLAVARALGDLWSLNKSLDTFIVSPEPDVNCIPVDPADRCLILASDGLWNMMNNSTAVKVVHDFEIGHKPYCLPTIGELQQSHATNLLDECMARWSRSRYRADNTTVLTIIFDNGSEVSDDEDEFSDTDSEITDSEEEIDPEAQNRIPFSANFVNQNMLYDLFRGHFDNEYQDQDDLDDLFGNKEDSLIGETIHEMSFQSTTLGKSQDSNQAEISDVLSSLIDTVSSQIDGLQLLDYSTLSYSPKSSCLTLGFDDTPLFSRADRLSKLESFNELTDEQLSDIRITQCSNWKASVFMQNNFNTVLTTERAVLGFKEHTFSSSDTPIPSFFTKESLTASCGNNNQFLPSQMCKVVLHESQNTISSSTPIADSTCNINTESLVSNGQAGLDLTKRSPTSPLIKFSESVSSDNPIISNAPISAAHQPSTSPSSLDSNTLPLSYSYNLSMNYKRKFEFVSDLSNSVVASNGTTDFASSLNLVGHHFAAKRFCGLESSDKDDYLSNSFTVKSNILDCSKNQVQIAAASNE